MVSIALRASRNPKGTYGLWPTYLSRSVNDGGHRFPSLFVISTHKTHVRDHTPLLGQAPRSLRGRKCPGW